MKNLLYSIGVLLLLTGCSDNYTDWANPQSNTEEPKTVTLALAPAADINFATLTTDSVQLFVPTVTASETAVNSYAAKLYNADKSASKTLQVDAKGRVKSSELADSINALYTCRPTQRTIAMDVTAFTKINGQSIQTTGTTTVKATPDAPEIDNTYYLTGTINSWNYNDKTFVVNNNGGDPYLNPVFSITLTAAQVGTGLEFKLTPASNLGKQDKCITATKDAAAGKIAYNNEGGALKVTPVAGTKYYRLDFDMLAQTYTVTEMSDPELFLTGNLYGWGATWKQLTPVNGTASTAPTFWTIIYLHAGESFKFAPQADWGDDFGSSATINDVAGAGASDDGGNIKVANAGWYLLKVVNSTTRSVDILAPNVYLIGTVAGNDWSIGAAHRFSIPTTESGEFVSPAFTTNGEVRMCVSLDSYDWWRTEFIVNAAGKIDYRGNGGDQDRVNVTAGQHAYLNFTAGTGSYH